MAKTAAGAVAAVVVAVPDKRAEQGRKADEGQMKRFDIDRIGDSCGVGFGDPGTGRQIHHESASGGRPRTTHPALALAYG